MTKRSFQIFNYCPLTEEHINKILNTVDLTKEVNYTSYIHFLKHIHCNPNVDIIKIGTEKYMYSGKYFIKKFIIFDLLLDTITNKMCLMNKELSIASYYLDYSMLKRALGRDIDRRLNYFTKTPAEKYTTYTRELCDNWHEYINF